MAFLENHGKNIQLSNQNLTAARVSSYNQGLLVTAQPLARQQLFQVTAPHVSSSFIFVLQVTLFSYKIFVRICQEPFLLPTSFRSTA